ncbi:Uncharacterized protein EbC_pEb17200860 (plasmid) [Erwinia billingiae Eb661]|uniref:Uncharacterized protein n=1 Tax=Erwinia billingiae (strain Eb661) TaxID=634500 RepID=D8MJU1_ERWBE|nr:Uncharacterized protein EbC_pEb17200860 [Erwinia billingiae Eb661]
MSVAGCIFNSGDGVIILQVRMTPEKDPSSNDIRLFLMKLISLITSVAGRIITSHIRELLSLHIGFDCFTRQ